MNRKENHPLVNRIPVWLWKAVLLSLLPLLCCIVVCAAEGKGISDVYLPASVWNDELFYFKQVEGIVHYGYPQGYFGFNESRALYLSFAAWSPVLVFPWILWGLLFGWTMLSPIYCNIFLMMLAVFLYTWLVKPTGRQMLLLSMLFVTFTPLTRYLLSGMPEVICFSMLVIFIGLSQNYMQRERTWKLAVLFGMAAIMTLMRPYLILFMIFPIYFWIRKSKWGIAGSLLILGGTGSVYVIIKHFLGAEYFTPLFDTTWVETFMTQGIFAGIKYVIWRLVHVGMTFTAMLREGFISGLASGALFGGFMLVLLILVLQSCVLLYRRKKEPEKTDRKDANQLVIYIGTAVCMLGMLAALLLMYKMTEGSKHLATFIVAGIFLIALMDTRAYKKQMIAAVLFVYLYTIKAVDPYDYQIPFQTEEMTADMEELQDTLSSALTLAREHTPNYDNDVIWVFSDSRQDNGEIVMTEWQRLYALPAGYGISCCYADYVKEHFETLQSKYIATIAGGEIEQLCVQSHKKRVAESGNMVLYRLR